MTTTTHITSAPSQSLLSARLGPLEPKSIFHNGFNVHAMAENTTDECTNKAPLQSFMAYRRSVVYANSNDPTSPVISGGHK